LRRFAAREDTMFQLIIGAIAGGLGVYFWGDRMRRYVDDRLPEMRTRAADSLKALEQKVGDNLRAAERATRPRPSASTSRIGTAQER
jgi:hypothetical protein